jgi:chemotaxis protein methyltransferase CheR
MNLGAESFTPPSAELDLIVCRNVTIYFDGAATQRLYRALIRTLAPGGWLMLGPSDPLPTDRAALERVETSDTVLWRRVTPVKTQRGSRSAAPVQLATPPARSTPEETGGDGRDELEAGLLALEAGSSATALDCLRRATFRDPRSPLAQFALGRAYVQNGDRIRARRPLVQARRLLAPLDGAALVPGSDALPVETLRQTIYSHLEDLRA